MLFCAEDNQTRCIFPTLWELYKQNNNIKQKDNSIAGSTIWYEESQDNWYIDENKKKEKKKNYCKIDNLSFLTPEFLRNIPSPVFRKMIKELRDYAITYPDEKNVQIYMIAQWIARERAEKFMKSWQNVVIAHPALDYTVVRPPHSYATMRKVLLIEGETDRFFKSLGKRNDVALIAFVSPGCVYCATQMPILNNFVSQYKIKLKYINVKEKPQVMVKFGIEAVPEVWLAVKGKGMTRVTAGLRTEDVIKQNIIRAYEYLTGKKVLPDIYKKENINQINYKQVGIPKEKNKIKKLW